MKRQTAFRSRRMMKPDSFSRLKKLFLSFKVICEENYDKS